MEKKKKIIGAEDFVRHLGALGAGKTTTIVPCAVYHPRDCGNCQLYLFEGLCEWVYKTANKPNPSTVKEEI